MYTNNEGKFLKADIIPIRQLGAGGPRIDANKAAIKKLKELTEKDFSEINLMIDDSGIITYLDH